MHACSIWSNARNTVVEKISTLLEVYKKYTASIQNIYNLSLYTNSVLFSIEKHI